MALSFRTRRTLANALGRARREPRQLLGLLIVIIYIVASLGMVVALLVVPLPEPLLEALNALVPGGLQTQLAGVRGGLTIALLLLACTAAFQNPLLQFGQSEIDLVFPAPIPTWRLLLDRLLLNHLRALAAAYFFWGLTVAPLLRLAGLELWPGGLWGILALMCMFATIDQGCAAALLWLAGHSRTRWLARTGLVILAGLMVLLIVIGLARLVSGNWALFQAISQFASSSLASRLLLPIGLATDVLLQSASSGETNILARIGLLVGLDLLTAVALVLVGRNHMRELALSSLGQGELLLKAVVRSRLNPLRLAQLLWHPETLDDEPSAGLTIPPFGRYGSAISWAKLVELQRNALRTLLALGALGLVPLLVVLQNDEYSLGRMVTAVVFSVSLGTQLFNDLGEHLVRADMELVLPVARWRLLRAAILARLPVYWCGGLILLLGVGFIQQNVDWGELAALALWYPLLLLPLLGLRGALMFVYPAAALPGRRDPVQAVVVLLVNGLLTMGLLLLSLLPLGVLLALTQFMAITMAWFWSVIYLGAGILSVIALATLAWAYGRYEPGEGI